MQECSMIATSMSILADAAKDVSVHLLVVAKVDMTVIV
jgi:hypothetical protein